MVREYLIPIGIGVILVGFVLVIVGTLLAAFRSDKTQTQGGFAVFIGPIPIVGATSQTIFYVLVALSVFAMLM
ncbi:MAG: hypothetical protein AUI60_04840, partial [Thaumarchaeota archaeon 13_1_40CM_2_39_4]